MSHSALGGIFEQSPQLQNFTNLLISSERSSYCHIFQVVFFGNASMMLRQLQSVWSIMLASCIQYLGRHIHFQDLRFHTQEESH